MTRRAIVALALLASCVLIQGAGWLSGPRFGVGSLGFRSVIFRAEAPAAAPAATGINSALFRNGLILELLPGNWHLNGSTIDIWYDSSGQGRNATQTTAINQPGVVDGLASFSKNNGLIFPFRSDSTLVIVKFKLAKMISPANCILGYVDYDNRGVFGWWDGEYGPGQFEWSVVYHSWAPGAFSAFPTSDLTDPITIGAYVSNSLGKSYAYSNYKGVIKVSDSFLSRALYISGLGFYQSGPGGGPGGGQGHYGTITAVWQWNIDPGLADFAAIASIAAAYDPARGY